MDYCKYHPLSGATWRCPACRVNLCDTCCNDGDERAGARCFLCDSALESLGSANTVQPFWRHLKQAFRFPLSMPALGLIIFLSVLTVIASAIPTLLLVSVPLYLFSVGAMLKYCFMCLESTALGKMTPPDVMESYQGGIQMLFELIILSVVFGFLIAMAFSYLGMLVGGLLLLITLGVYPAILIRYAYSHSMLDALNLFAAIRLVISIGLPYGLLIVFIFIMISSVGLLNRLSAEYLPFAYSFLETFIANYYLVVVFHLMGYMVFQYQDELGFAARIDDEEDEKKQRTEIDLLRINMDLLLKEGDYEKLVKLYHQAFKRYPAETTFYDRYFEMLLAASHGPLLQEFGSLYFEALVRQKRQDRLTLVLRQILQRVPDYLPESPSARLQLAQQLNEQGDCYLAARMLTGMPAEYPEFAQLRDAYKLFLELLKYVPELNEQADAWRESVERIKEKAKQLATPKGAAQGAAQGAAPGSAPASPVAPASPAPQPVAATSAKQGSSGFMNDIPKDLFAEMTFELLPMDQEEKNSPQE